MKGMLYANLHLFLHSPSHPVTLREFQVSSIDFMSATTQTVRRKRPVLQRTNRESTSAVIRELREDYGISQSLLVRLSGYSPRSIVSWGKGTKATRPASIKFRELSRLMEALADLTRDPGEVAAWLQEPNEAFDGSTPLQVIERGESDRIWRMIYFLRSGEPR